MLYAVEPRMWLATRRKVPDPNPHLALQQFLAGDSRCFIECGSRDTNSSALLGSGLANNSIMFRALRMLTQQGTEFILHQDLYDKDGRREQVGEIDEASAHTSVVDFFANVRIKYSACTFTIRCANSPSVLAFVYLICTGEGNGRTSALHEALTVVKPRTSGDSLTVEPAQSKLCQLLNEQILTSTYSTVVICTCHDKADLHYMQNLLALVRDGPRYRLHKNHEVLAGNFYRPEPQPPVSTAGPPDAGVVEYQITGLPGDPNDDHILAPAPVPATKRPEQPEPEVAAGEPEVVPDAGELESEVVAGEPEQLESEVVAGEPEQLESEVVPNAGEPEQLEPEVVPDAGEPEQLESEVVAGEPEQLESEVVPNAGEPEQLEPEVVPDAGELECEVVSDAGKPKIVAFEPVAGTAEQDELVTTATVLDVAPSVTAREPLRTFDALPVAKTKAQKLCICAFVVILGISDISHHLQSNPEDGGGKGLATVMAERGIQRSVTIEYILRRNNSAQFLLGTAISIAFTLWLGIVSATL